MKNITANPKKFYHENGYVIYRALINPILIDSYLSDYTSDLLTSNIELPLMNTQSYGKPRINQYGFLQDPIADIHQLNHINKKFDALTQSALNIICSDNIRLALNDIYANGLFTVVMSMFFDQNAGTPPHQDCYYLDSLPNGNLTAAWIALEDIHADAGRFYLAKGTNHVHFNLSQSEIFTSDLYEKKVGNFLRHENYSVITPELKKGDVIFWNSRTIHGSHPTIDESKSRKSFTAHFISNSDQFVQNSYNNELRSFDYFLHNQFRCRLTNSLKKNAESSKLKPRSIDTFNTKFF